MCAKPLTVFAKLHNFYIDRKLPGLRQRHDDDMEDGDSPDVLLNSEEAEPEVVRAFNKRTAFTAKLKSEGVRSLCCRSPYWMTELSGDPVGKLHLGLKCIGHGRTGGSGCCLGGGGGARVLGFAPLRCLAARRRRLRAIDSLSLAACAST